MPERYQFVLKVGCLILAAVAIVQVTRLFGRTDPLAGLTLAGTPAQSRLTNQPALGTNLAPAVQARLDLITQSEILAAVVRPQPMALLGLAGLDAFIRAPNGQTVILREGEESSGIKLVRIGTNRVLIEHEDQTKELTLFSGFGSTTLLPQDKK